MKTNRLMLLQAQIDNESEVWTELVRSYQPLIERWVSLLGCSGADVADITQEVLCTLVVELPNFEHNGRTGAFRSWLRTMTVNRIRQHWGRRKQARTETGEKAEQTLKQLADPDSELADRWNKEHDQHVFQQLLTQAAVEFDPKALTAFLRFAVGNEDAEVVAKDLGITASQVYKYKFRVSRRMKELAASFQSMGLDPVVPPALAKTIASSDDEPEK